MCFVKFKRGNLSANEVHTQLASREYLFNGSLHIFALLVQPHLKEMRVNGRLTRCFAGAGSCSHKIRLTASVEVTVSLTSPWWGAAHLLQSVGVVASSNWVLQIQQTKKDIWQEMLEEEDKMRNIKPVS